MISTSRISLLGILVGQGVKHARFHFVQAPVTHVFSILTTCCFCGLSVLVVPGLVSRVLILCVSLVLATYTAGRFIFLGSWACAIPLFLLLLKNYQFLCFICCCIRVVQEALALSLILRLVGLNENQQEIRIQGGCTFSLPLRGHICFLTYKGSFSLFRAVGLALC